MEVRLYLFTSLVMAPIPFLKMFPDTHNSPRRSWDRGKAIEHIKIDIVWSVFVLRFHEFL